MQVVKYADEVTISYLKKCIQHVYKGLNFSDKFTEKFFKVLLNDYQNKAYNLAWFLTEESTGRILNYREMTPTPAEIIREGRKEKGLDYLLKFMTFKGIEYTDEDIINNKCTYKKQVQKISKLLPTLLKESIPSSEVTGAVPEFLISSVNDGATMTTLGAFIYNTDGTLYSFTPVEDITVKVGSVLANRNSAFITDRITKLSSDIMKVSIDLADTLLAATGSTSSCISPDGSYHIGTLMNFRSDFTMLCFTHTAGDRFSKKGRTWLYNRVTEKGQVRNFSFFKFQRLYGTVSTAHLGLVEDFIYERTNKHFNLPKSKFKTKEHSIDRTDTNNDLSNIGYIDASGKGVKAWHIVTDSIDNFRLFNVETALVFPDPINVSGNISNMKSFNFLHREVREISILNPRIYMVKCELTGNQEIDTACIQINNKWYSKEGLKGVIGLTPVKPEPVEKAVAMPTLAVQVDELDNDDMQDF